MNHGRRECKEDKCLRVEHRAAACCHMIIRSKRASVIRPGHRQYIKFNTLISIAANPPMSYPTKIKAIGINETGGVEVIQNLEVPFPEVKPDDLLVKACHSPLSPIVGAMRIVICRWSGLVSTSSTRISGELP